MKASLAKPQYIHGEWKGALGRNVNIQTPLLKSHNISFVVLWQMCSLKLGRSRDVSKKLRRHTYK